VTHLIEVKDSQETYYDKRTERAYCVTHCDADGVILRTAYSPFDPEIEVTWSVFNVHFVDALGWHRWMNELEMKGRTI
jgi:hypothetical protein